MKDEAQSLDLKLNDGVHFRAQVFDAESKESIAGFTLYHRTNAAALLQADSAHRHRAEAFAGFVRKRR